MSGEVVLNPDMTQAETLPVRVEDEQMKAFGTWSPRFICPSLALLFLLSVTRWALSIHIERAAEPTQILWWRWASVATVGNLTVMQQAMCFIYSVALCGEDVSLAACSFAGICGLVAMAVPIACGLPLAEFQLGTIYAVSSLWAPIAQLCLRRQRSRWVGPHLKWGLGLLAITWGCLTIVTATCLAYTELLASGWSVAANILLPLVTALSEAASVACVSLLYSRTVWPLSKGGDATTAGDQLLLPATVLVLTPHGVCEAARLVSIFAGAVTTGSFLWIQTLLLTLLANVLARLGWTRWILFHTLKRTVGELSALRLSTPGAFNKLHDEIKFYVGYFRFLPVLAIVVARALMYGVMSLENPPSFNLSASWCILGLILMEVLEDVIISWELLPESPIPHEILRVRESEESCSNNPCWLLAVEYRPGSKAPDPDIWRLRELDAGSALVKLSSIAPHSEAEAEVIQKCVSLGGQPRTSWALLRSWLGQKRSVVPAPALHGLRELPLVVQCGVAGILSLIAENLLCVVLGPGFLRGFTHAPCIRISSIFWWDIPMTC